MSECQLGSASYTVRLYTFVISNLTEYLDLYPLIIVCAARCGNNMSYLDGVVSVFN